MKTPAWWDRRATSLIGPLLSPVAGLYHLADKINRAFTPPWQAEVPVICVGNLVSGGAGKTPVVCALIQHLKAQGLHPHVVSRGYGGREVGPVLVDVQSHTAADVGDEPLLIAAHTPCWIAKERPQGVQAATDAGADIVVLDDGFQNPSVTKDLSLLVVDGDYGFGNGRLIPAGPLREPVEGGLKRADALVLIGADNADIKGRLRRLNLADKPILRARIFAEGLEPLQGHRFLAFSGIGHPEKFFATAKTSGLNVQRTHSFADHHPYTSKDMDGLLDEAASIKAKLLTTAKDAVRVPPAYRDQVSVLPIRLGWDEPDSLDQVLSRLNNADHD